MSINKPSSEAQEALILLHGADSREFERVIGLVEEANGRVLAAYGHQALVAQLTSDSIDRLRREPGVRSVDTKPIDQGRMQAAAEPIHTAMLAWNQHLAKRGAPPAAERRGLSWDAPGMLPPDPPQEIREMLLRRQQEMEDDQENDE